MQNRQGLQAPLHRPFRAQVSGEPPGSPWGHLMARRGAGFWGALLGAAAPAPERFSLESLRDLHDVLQRNAVVTDANRDTVVEALRSIAELMIWGDQHDARFFDYFAENSLLAHFTAFLVQRSNRRGDVAKQVLQTLSILIQNIRSTTAIFYLFSNNHVNEIVALRFDFEDDEVLGYYINLLKTVSLKLNSSTVQFFYQDDGEHAAFPLYTEAVKFINHRDGMARSHSRHTHAAASGALPSRAARPQPAALVSQPAHAVDCHCPRNSAPRRWWPVPACRAGPGAAGACCGADADAQRVLDRGPGGAGVCGEPAGEQLFQRAGHLHRRAVRGARPRAPDIRGSPACGEGGAGAPGSAEDMRLQWISEPGPCPACDGRALAGLSRQT